MSAEQNIATTRRWVEEAWNRGDFSSVERLYDPNYVSHSLLPGAPPNVEGLQQFISTFHQAMPDFHIQLEDVFGDADKVAWRMVASGTQTGTFMGVPATGQAVAVPGMVILHFNEQGQIKEDWANWDQLAMLTQLGVIPELQPA
jgi:steroid delta-isomerase-like uncharacterized protein